ncbi:hypothetical protein OCU04_002195 [Sclerotinia nivalis]|uniref:Fungal N-terminal domain-containing protein n=1 Tax=Sclerotinia nivalis TaxID=352851 RepID=A0A9X0AZN9_9HELO|nr:hypothetical protein OCU04_002195 [Sclerotinia nivalis]
MSIGFGFSVGDFIAAIDLVAAVVDALRESGNSSSEFREIVRQLDALEDTLRRVKRLELDDTQRAEGIALQKAASCCQITIDDFWKKIQKYQPHLQNGGSGSRLKDGWMKIVWATCKSDDMIKFKAGLAGHTSSIQLASIATNEKSQASRPNDELAHLTLYSGLTMGERILDATLEIKSTVMKTNLRIFQMVLEIHHVITRIPGHVDRQQPVYFIDALGRHTPFYLEFIRSKEAFVSVLKTNFLNVGWVASKIENGNFTIQDSATKRDIRVGNDWELWFSPGQ